MKYNDVIRITARLKREDIAYICGILESYDDLAVVRTICTEPYIVEFLVSPSYINETRRLLKELEKETGLAIIDNFNNF